LLFSRRPTSGLEEGVTTKTPGPMLTIPPPAAEAKSIAFWMAWRSSMLSSGRAPNHATLIEPFHVRNQRPTVGLVLGATTIPPSSAAAELGLKQN